MNISLYSTDIPELAISHDYSGLTNDYNEWRFELDHALGSGHYREIDFGNIRIGYGNVTMAQKTTLHFESNFESVEMHFSLNGYSSTHARNSLKNVNFEPNQHNIIYGNNVKGLLEWQDTKMEIFEVNLHLDFFKKYLPEESKIFDAFRQSIENGLTSLMKKQNRHISQSMYRVIYEIIRCQRKGFFKRMFIEAKVIELLLLQFEQLCETEFSNVTLKKQDVEKMYAVREFILGNLTESYSLINLAQEVGTNEFTLKKGFKELFGTTVFGFWSDAKMEEAYKMLLTKTKSVSQVSDIIGYKNPQHFTAAFKRKYGIVPSQVLKY